MVLNDLLGRKLSIMFSAVPSAAGYALMAGAHGFWMLLLGRTLTGFAGGLTAACIPVRPGLPTPVPSLPQHCADRCVAKVSCPPTPRPKPPGQWGYVCRSLGLPAAGQLICPRIPSQPHSGFLEVPTHFLTVRHIAQLKKICVEQRGKGKSLPSLGLLPHLHTHPVKGQGKASRGPGILGGAELGCPWASHVPTSGYPFQR